MNEQSIGLMVAVVAMLGTLLALGVQAALVALLHRAFPEPVPGAEARGPSPAGSTRDSKSGTRS